MGTAVVLFTRDLRVHDHPALVAAVGAAAEVVPLFVLDPAIAMTPNRGTYLLQALADLRAALRERGGDLVVRRGDVVAEVARVVDAVGAVAVHLTDDVSAYARDRLARLRGAVRAEVVTHPGHLLVAPGAVAPANRDHYEVFTPYWRVWREQPQRAPLPPPAAIRLPAGLDPGPIPALADLTTGAPSPDLIVGGEVAARQRLDRFIDRGIDEYETRRDVLADDDGTSRLSADLHFGALSVAEIADRLDLRRRGHEPYLRQLCWREFNHQLLAVRPRLPVDDHRPRGDRWRDDDDAFIAWTEGCTGIPLVDAGMRQLQREGYMHNRARMVTASFLTKHLYVDWRRGAAHFAEWLVDADVANNSAGWQWVAGTGTDTRPNRVLNPVTQSRRYDPHGSYLRRHVPELADLGDDAIHEPWRHLDATTHDYPPPIVDLAEARTRFVAARRG
jgi:deoxyribodipyrimidine photo-lyase